MCSYHTVERNAWSNVGPQLLLSDHKSKQIKRIIIHHSEKIEDDCDIQTIKEPSLCLRQNFGTDSTLAIEHLHGFSK